MLQAVCGLTAKCTFNGRREKVVRSGVPAHRAHLPMRNIGVSDTSVDPSGARADGGLASFWSGSDALGSGAASVHISNGKRQDSHDTSRATEHSCLPCKAHGVHSLDLVQCPTVPTRVLTASVAKLRDRFSTVDHAVL